MKNKPAHAMHIEMQSREAKTLRTRNESIAIFTL